MILSDLQFWKAVQFQYLETKMPCCRQNSARCISPVLLCVSAGLYCLHLLSLKAAL